MCVCHVTVEGSTQEISGVSVGGHTVIKGIAYRYVPTKEADIVQNAVDTYVVTTAEYERPLSVV